MKPFTPVSIASFDDGTGPALYIGCRAVEDYDVPQTNLVRWDGSAFTPFELYVDGEISALAVFDDGAGPALYAGGNFTTIDGNSASAIAMWDGDHWHRVGVGMTGAYWPAQVLAMAVFDDGSGPALYAGGYFIAADGKPANNIAKWDGANWSALGNGTDAYVQSLAVFDDGSGPALYAAGYFGHAGDVDASAIARWDGSSWTPLGAGLGDIHGDKTPLVPALRVFNGGDGPALFAGGSFTRAGEVTAWDIARWDGSQWAAVGGGITGVYVDSLEIFDDGGGPRLYAGGAFEKAGNVAANGIASWDGHVWRSPDGGVEGPGGPGAVHSMGVLDHPDLPGPILLACGIFIGAGDAVARDIAAWDGSEWSAPLLRTDISGFIHAFAVHDDGTGHGPCLYAGGAVQIGRTNGLGRWDGSSWSTVGAGVHGVHAFAVFDDGSGTGPMLYAAYESPGLLRWNGVSWKSVGAGVSGRVNALAVFDDGSGPALYIGGRFFDAHNNAASMAKWNGSNWDNACDTLTNYYLQAEVYSLQVYDEGKGAGPALFAGGEFNRAGDLIVGHIARWNGSEWTGLNLGADKAIQSMTIHDFDGDGPNRPRLCVGGTFTQIGDHVVHGLASWDGTYWAPLGDLGNDPLQEPTVYALASFDRDAAGPESSMLYAGGIFDSISGISIRGLARFDGVSWNEVDGGVYWQQDGAPRVYSLQSADLPRLGHSLFVGGEFDTAGGVPSFGIARYGCPPPPPCYPDLDASGTLDLFDFLAFVNLFNAAAPKADCDGNRDFDLFDFLCFVNGFNAGC